MQPRKPAGRHCTQLAGRCITAMMLPRLQVTGGRNGYGAKLANIFSTKFVVRLLAGW